jgi:hypothetical protein
VLMFGTYSPDGALELDHCLCMAAEDGAGGPRFDIDEFDRMRPPYGNRPASIVAVSGVLMPLCLWLELGVCRLGDPSLPMDPVRLEPICVEGLFVVLESESAMIVFVGERWFSAFASAWPLTMLNSITFDLMSS